MNYKTHIVGGLSAGLIANSILLNTVTNSHKVLGNINTHLFTLTNAKLVGGNLLLTAVFVAGAVIGALIPDFDHRKSYLGRRAPVTSYVTNKVFGHRGLLHTPIYNFLFVLILCGVVNTFGTGVGKIMALRFLVGLGVGAFSHLFLDMMNKQGIPLLYPFKKKHIRILTIKTDGWLQNIVSPVIIMLTLTYFLK